MKTISNTEIEIVDFTSICDCGWESYAPTLASAKEIANIHLSKYCPKAKRGTRVFIDRNKDSEIDDTFKSVIVMIK